MHTLYTRVLDASTLSDGDGAEPTHAVDLGEYRELHIFVRVTEAGTGESPTLVVEHSSRGETDTYVPFETPVSVDLTTTGNTWVQVSGFLRYVAWRLTGTLSASAVVTLDIVAKR